MTIWILNEASSIPSVPSDAHPAAGVSVEVNDANEVVNVTPLVQHHSFVLDPVEEKPAVDKDKEVAADKKDSDAAKPDDTASEQAQP